MKPQVFMEAMRMEALGFAFGEPWRAEDSSISCIVPLLRGNGGGIVRYPDYLVLSEAKRVTLKDTGSINRASVFNGEDMPVFIRTGEILHGNTQERSVVTSQIIMPGENATVDVVCVHATKGIQAGQVFTSSGDFTPNRDNLYLHATVNYGGGRGMSSGFGGGLQGSSWQADREYYGQLRGVAEASKGVNLGYGSFNFNPDNLTKSREVSREVFKDLMVKVPLFDSQIGMGIIDDKGFYMLDCFDLPASWKAIKEGIVGKECLAIAQTDSGGVFSYRPERAKSLLQEVLASGFEESVVINGVAQTIALDNQKYMGEVVVLNDALIHLLITRK